MAVAGTCTHPAFFRDHHGHWLVHHLDFGHCFFLFLNQRAAWVGKGFGVGFNFFDHQAAQRRWVAHDVFKLGLFVAQLFELLLNLDRFQTRQLTQANFQDVFGLAFAEFEALHQRLLGLVALTDDGNHLVDVEQHQLTTFQDMDAVQHFVQTVLRAAQDGGRAELNPLGQHLAQRLRHRTAIDTHHGEVDGRRSF